MLNIEEMRQDEIHELLHKTGYGHLGFIDAGKPQVMAIHYYLHDTDIYLLTTAKMKHHQLDANPEICLQVEEIHSPLQWRSVVVSGRAECLSVEPDIVGVASRNENRAIKYIKQRNPAFSPASNRTWIDSWGHGEAIAIYSDRTRTYERTCHRWS
ncbi:pyridoxamine 5'-phosphate oxidase family protein [Chamaesiphon sp. OTE_8_metabat_110]|uniref:pyridoxamine 5'-phosphate oxidase family protein n=1 Tax=Chamaesiphon sp. OTE_8_metabat_110 TaxID=2964696 RepID=UPI00286D5FC8|nr:pyridoxamine 5'-phosphate oxidase family protein [Chamaesiphon sp. OTE_8_metabat_110]